MYSLTDEIGIDIEVVITELPGVAAGMMESTEESKRAILWRHCQASLRLGPTGPETGAAGLGRANDWSLWWI
jgi:hypothetical protein